MTGFVRRVVAYSTLSKAAKHYTTLTTRQHRTRLWAVLHNLPPHSRIHNIRHHMLWNTFCSRPWYATRAVIIVLTRISSTLNNLTISQGMILWNVQCCPLVLHLVSWHLWPGFFAVRVSHCFLWCLWWGESQTSILCKRKSFWHCFKWPNIKRLWCWRYTKTNICL